MPLRQSVRSAAGSVASGAFKALVVIVFVLFFLDSGFEIDITTVALMLGVLASPRLLIGFAVEPARRVLRRQPVRNDRNSASSPTVQHQDGVAQPQ